MSAFSLLGKVAIVTGSQRGVGLGIVHELAAAGAHVLLTGIVDGAGEESARALRSDGHSVHFRHMDTTDETDVAAALNHLDNVHGRVDIAVANAAYRQRNGMML